MVHYWKKDGKSVSSVSKRKLGANVRIKFLVDGILAKVRNHGEDVKLDTGSRGSLRHEHVLWPTTAAEPELGERVLILGCGSGTNGAEGSLVRDRNARLIRATHDRVHAGVH